VAVFLGAVGGMDMASFFSAQLVQSWLYYVIFRPGRSSQERAAGLMMMSFPGCGLGCYADQ
jgi:hypothetical protein